MLELRSFLPLKKTCQMIFRKLHPSLKAIFWLLSKADLFVSLTFTRGCDVPCPTAPAPGPPNHPPEALGSWVICPLMCRVAATGFIHSLFLGNALYQLQIGLVKYFPSKPFLTENSFWTQWKLLWRRKIKIKPAQLMLETFIRNSKLFSSLKSFWEGTADAKEAIFSR